jgi:RNase P protein component
MRAGDFATIDIIVLARSGLAQLDNSAITAMLNSLFDKLCHA